MVLDKLKFLCRHWIKNYPCLYKSYMFIVRFPDISLSWSSSNVLQAMQLRVSVPDTRKRSATIEDSSRQFFWKIFLKNFRSRMIIVTTLWPWEFPCANGFGYIDYANTESKKFIKTYQKNINMMLTHIWQSTFNLLYKLAFYWTKIEDTPHKDHTDLRISFFISFFVYYTSEKLTVIPAQ